MFSKNQIDNWLDLFELSDNKDADLYNNKNRVGETFLQKNLLEAKMMTDRWNNCLNHWIFHSSRKDQILSLFPVEKIEPLPEEIKSAIKTINSLYDDVDNKDLKNIIDIIFKYLQEPESHIWGAQVSFTDDINPNIGIGLVLNNDNMTLQSSGGNLTNSIVVFDIF